jgi:hypothetical protein
MILLTKTIGGEDDGHGTVNLASDWAQCLIHLSDSFVGAFLALAFLKKHLGTHPAYIRMVESINQELLHVQLMQSWGHMVSSHGPGNLSTFNPHKLRDICLGLCRYFYLPVSLVLYYLQQDTAENLKASHAITNEMAVYYQSQND